MNATKYISIKVGSEEVDGGVPKAKALAFVRFFERSVQNFIGRKNKLIIKGRQATMDAEETMIEEGINFFADKIKDFFVLDEPNVATHLQYTDRKNGIMGVYERNRITVGNLLRRDE